MRKPARINVMRHLVFRTATVQCVVSYCTKITQCNCHNIVLRRDRLSICDGLGFPPLSRPVARRRSSSRTGLGYRCCASTHPLKRIANGSHQGSHSNPPSNGVSAPARVPCMCTPPNFSIKAVHATPRGSLLVSCWLSHI